jgi:transposase
MRVHHHCCGLDVHKKMIAACLIREDAEGNSVTEKRLFGSMTRELQELAQWLCAAQVTAVAMEATGVYWMPVWNVLEPYGLQLLLINPEHSDGLPESRAQQLGIALATLVLSAIVINTYLLVFRKPLRITNNDT